MTPTALYLDGDGRVTATYPDGTERQFSSMLALMAEHGVDEARVALEDRR